jgi:hypothetical protein
MLRVINNEIGVVKPREGKQCSETESCEFDLVAAGGQNSFLLLLLLHHVPLPQTALLQSLLSTPPLALLPLLAALSHIRYPDTHSILSPAGGAAALTAVMRLGRHCQ